MTDDSATRLVDAIDRAARNLDAVAPSLQAIERALARLGEEHTPPAGWESRVLQNVLPIPPGARAFIAKMSPERRRAYTEELAVTQTTMVVTLALRERGVSQAALASALGVHDSRVSKIVNGNGNPTIKTLARIADALGMELRISFAKEEPSNEAASEATGDQGDHDPDAGGG